MKKYLEKTCIILLLFVPIALWLLPATFFDRTGITLCPSKYFLGIECLGCGMTRAVMHLHHFELEKALGFNRGVVVAYPALVVLWFVWVKKAATALGLSKRSKNKKQ